MFIVIYSFQVKDGFEEPFENAWRELTFLFRDYAGGLGSRLHLESGQNYIAYAQWPDKETWEASNSKLPDETSKIRKAMRDAIEKIKILYELNVVDDLLIKKFD